MQASHECLLCFKRCYWVNVTIGCCVGAAMLASQHSPVTVSFDVVVDDILVPFGSVMLPASSSTRCLALAGRLVINTAHATKATKACMRMGAMGTGSLLKMKKAAVGTAARADLFHDECAVSQA